MRKQDRRRRTAHRARSGSTADRSGPVEPQADEALSADRIGGLIIAAATDTAFGNGRLGRQLAHRLGAASGLTDEIGEGVRSAGERIVAHAFEHGWLPADLHQAARRRVDRFATAFLVDAMASHLRPFAPATVDETWRSQLDELDARVWWSPSTAHLAQWAAKHMLTPVETLTTVVDALALLIGLPKLTLIRPLPGAARPQPPAGNNAPKQDGADEKVLGRVRGLLAKAESTSFPEEAEALSAKAQELMTKHALDRALVDADTTARYLPGARRLWLDTPYVDAKALLVDVVGKANRCRAIFDARWGFLTLIGDETDLSAVELLTTSLLVQATRTMVSGDGRTARGGQSRTRSFRKSFLVAYATRIGERLDQASRTMIAQSPDADRLLPVLASQQRRVDEAFDTMFPTARGKSVSVGNMHGWDAGRAAADRARLDGQRALEK